MNDSSNSRTNTVVEYKPHVLSSTLSDLPEIPAIPKVARSSDAWLVLDNMKINVQRGSVHRERLPRPMPVVREAFASMMIAALVLLVFNSNGLVTWTNNLPTSRSTETATVIAQTWHGWMEQSGIAPIVETIRQVIVELREADWVRSDDGLEGDDLPASEREPMRNEQQDDPKSQSA